MSQNPKPDEVVVDLRTKTRQEIVDSMIEVKLIAEDSFPKIKETLTRIGIATNNKVLYQTCHILHKKGRYYLPTFKELFGLDNKGSIMTVEDYSRRNKIAKLLESWGLLEIIRMPYDQYQQSVNMRVIQHRDKSKWELRSKYSIGWKPEPPIPGSIPTS